MNILERLDDIARRIEEKFKNLRIHASQIDVVHGLSDITKRLGLIQSGELRFGNSIEPGFGFTGIRFGYPPFVYSSVEWIFAIVVNDVLISGIRYSPGGSFYLGGATTALRMDAGGDAVFIGAGSGFQFGSAYGNEINFGTGPAVQNTWYAIDDVDMSDGGLNGVTHDGAGKLTVTNGGMYLVNYAVSMECNTNGKHIQSGILVGSVIRNDGIVHHETQGANAEFFLSGTAIISISAGSFLQIGVRTTDTGTPSLTVDHLNISIVQIGGI